MADQSMKLTMDEFLVKIVEEFYKPNTGAAIAKTVAMTVLANLMSLPFGRISMSLSRNKTKAEVKENLEAQLYFPFKTKLFEDFASKDAKRKNKADYVLFLDSLPLEYKMKILDNAIKSEKEYAKFVSSDSWRHKLAA